MTIYSLNAVIAADPQSGNNFNQVWFNDLYNIPSSLSNFIQYFNSNTFRLFENYRPALELDGAKFTLKIDYDEQTNSISGANITNIVKNDGTILPDYNSDAFVGYFSGPDVYENASLVFSQFLMRNFCKNISPAQIDRIFSHQFNNFGSLVYEVDLELPRTERTLDLTINYGSDRFFGYQTPQIIESYNTPWYPLQQYYQSSPDVMLYQFLQNAIAFTTSNSETSGQWNVTITYCSNIDSSNQIITGYSLNRANIILRNVSSYQDLSLNLCKAILLVGLDNIPQSLIDSLANIYSLQELVDVCQASLAGRNSNTYTFEVSNYSSNIFTGFPEFEPINSLGDNLKNITRFTPIIDKYENVGVSFEVTAYTENARNRKITKVTWKDLSDFDNTVNVISTEGLEQNTVVDIISLEMGKALFANTNLTMDKLDEINNSTTFGQIIEYCEVNFDSRQSASTFLYQGYPGLVVKTLEASNPLDTLLAPRTTELLQFMTRLTNYVRVPVGVAFNGYSSLSENNTIEYNRIEGELGYYEEGTEGYKFDLDLLRLGAEEFAEIASLAVAKSTILARSSISVEQKYAISSIDNIYELERFCNDNLIDLQTTQAETTNQATSENYWTTFVQSSSQATTSLLPTTANNIDTTSGSSQQLVGQIIGGIAVGGASIIALGVVALSIFLCIDKICRNRDCVRGYFFADYPLPAERHERKRRSESFQQNIELEEAVQNNPKSTV